MLLVEISKLDKSKVSLETMSLPLDMMGLLLFAMKILLVMREDKKMQ